MIGSIICEGILVLSAIAFAIITINEVKLCWSSIKDKKENK